MGKTRREARREKELSEVSEQASPAQQFLREETISEDVAPKKPKKKEKKSLVARCLPFVLVLCIIILLGVLYRFCIVNSRVLVVGWVVGC